MTPSAPTLDIATPERVALDLPLAGLGYRAMAYLVDACILFGAWVCLFFAGSLLNSDLAGRFGGLSGLTQSLLVVGAFALQWMFWTCLEGLGGGRTLGKRLVRIRVVRDDGSPVGLFEAAVRNLCRLIDFLPSFYGVGVLTMLFSRQHRRLGDWLAGTVVIRDQEADLDRYVAAAAAASPGASAAQPLPTAELERLLAFLERAPGLEPAHRETLSQRMLERHCPALSEADRSRLAASWEETERALRAALEGRGS